MNSKKFLIISVIAATLTTFIIYHTFNKESGEIPKEVEVNSLEDKILTELNSLSLEEKIGQMLIISIPGNKMSEELQEELSICKPGGVIFFKDNISSYEQTSAFINDLEKTANIPMFISLDQEGGRIQRLKNLPDLNISNIPDMAKLGEINDLSLTYEVGAIIAREMRILGFNMDFAPVADVVIDKSNNVIGDRSFGKYAELVAKHVNSLANGLEDNNVLAVYKHFPGHGTTVTDSHYELPVLKETKEELWQQNLIPFQKAISNKASIIMVGHLALPNVTGNDIPASLSKEIITDLLKKEMGYQGLVITDALNMKAITDNYQEQEIYEMAINAGVDLLLMPKGCQSTIDYIKESIEEGKITEEQINESAKKILLLKRSKLSTTKLDKTVIDTYHHADTLKSIS